MKVLGISEFVLMNNLGMVTNRAVRVNVDNNTKRLVLRFPLMLSVLVIMLGTRSIKGLEMKYFYAPDILL